MNQYNKIAGFVSFPLWEKNEEKHTYSHKYLNRLICGYLRLSSSNLHSFSCWCKFPAWDLYALSKWTIKNTFNFNMTTPRDAKKKKNFLFEIVITHLSFNYAFDSTS